MIARGIPDEVGFRPVRPGDLPFLYRLYASTREDELAVTGWSRAEKDAFLEMQFQAQHRHYREHFPAARFDVIAWRGEPVGRLYVEERSDEYRLIDIALLPDFRNRGIGGAILEDLLARAAAAGKAVRIHVEHFNPALHLYRRLGFELLEDKGVYHFMEWRPPEARTSGPGDPG